MCMIDDCDGLVTMVRDGAWHVARKGHKCAECHRRIVAGERYHSEVFIFEGAFNSHKTCAHCMVARQWLQAECGGYAFGAIEEDVREHCHSGGHPIGVYRLAIGMRHCWARKDGMLRALPTLPTTTHERMKVATSHPTPKE